MKTGNCQRCGKEYTYYFRERLCKECKLLPKPSRMPGKRQDYQHIRTGALWNEFLAAHPSLVWWPRPNRVMYKGGNYGWITGLDDHDGPADPIGIGFFRPKTGANVTVLLDQDPVTKKRTLRFEPRCWATTRKRKIRYKKWQNWMEDTDACPCLGCLASRTLNKLAKEHYDDHIKDEEENLL